MLALVSKRHQNDTSIIDNRKLFGPEISLINIDQIWQSSRRHPADQWISCTHCCIGASTVATSLTEPSSLRSRAQALVNAGAAVNIEGAEMVLNTMIDFIVNDRREFRQFTEHEFHADPSKYPLQKSWRTASLHLSELRSGHSCPYPEAIFILPHLILFSMQ